MQFLKSVIKILLHIYNLLPFEHVFIKQKSVYLIILE